MPKLPAKTNLKLNLSPVAVEVSADGRVVLCLCFICSEHYYIIDLDAIQNSETVDIELRDVFLCPWCRTLRNEHRRRRRRGIIEIKRHPHDAWIGEKCQQCAAPFNNLTKVWQHSPFLEFFCSEQCGMYFLLTNETQQI